MRRMVDLDGFKGYQHRGALAAPVSKVAFPLTDETVAPHLGPDLVALGLRFPNAELSRVLSQKFLAGTTAPIHEGIVHHHILLVAHARDHDQDGTSLESRTEK